MSVRLRPGHRVYVYRELIDLRSGFEKLSMLVREKMQKNILEGDLYVFMGRNRKRLKAICFDGTGMLLIIKRLEKGQFMSLQDLDEPELTSDELDILLRGSLIRRSRFGKEALTLSRGMGNVPWHEATGSRDGHPAS